MFGGRTAKQSPNRSPNEPKNEPKRTPEDQNDAPKRCWISGSILASILSLFGGPKRPPKRHPKSLKIRPLRPRAAQRPPGSLQGASRDPPRRPPGNHFGLILGPPGAHFRVCSVSSSKLAHTPPHDRKHSSKSLARMSFETAAGRLLRLRPLLCSSPSVSFRPAPSARWPVLGRMPL